jgi:hypothetical protein
LTPQQAKALPQVIDFVPLVIRRQGWSCAEFSFA